MNSQKNRQQRINLKTSQNVLPSGSCSKKYSQFNFNAHGSTWNYLFIFSEVCTIQFQNSIGLLNLSIEKDFLVTSKFSLRFASALGIGSQSLARRLYLAFSKKWPPERSVHAEFLAGLSPLVSKLIRYLSKNQFIFVEINIYGNRIILRLNLWNQTNRMTQNSKNKIE